MHKLAAWDARTTKRTNPVVNRKLRINLIMSCRPSYTSIPTYGLPAAKHSSPSSSSDSLNIISPKASNKTCIFSNNLGECLNDEPQESLYKDRNMLPGTLYDAEYQCNLAFPGSKVCGGDPEKFCAQILCQTSPTSCMSNGEPFADGTKCGVNKVSHYPISFRASSDSIYGR